MNKKAHLIRSFEAVLFASKEKVHRSRLLSIINDVSEEFSVDDIINELRLLFSESYINIISEGDYYFFDVDLSFSNTDKEIKDVKSVSLDGSSLTTLSVIALHQPITFNQINEILPDRITKKVINRLEDLDLVSGEYRQQDTGRAIVYITTDKFLSIFGLDDIDELPSPEDVLDQYSK